jgi:shikimate kinase
MHVLMQELMPFKACIVSTGGGVVVRRKNWGFMQHGIVVWLDGPPELLARRACQEDTSTRPLLEDSSEQIVSTTLI